MAQPEMLVMTDVDDVFVPMVDGFLVTVSEARTVLERYFVERRQSVAILLLSMYWLCYTLVM